MSIPKNLTVQQLKDRFEGAKTVVHEYGGLSTDTVNFKLNPETWSCVEVCQHLIRFNDMYYNQMEKALNELTTVPVNGSSFSPGFVARKVAEYLEPPYKFGIKTIKPMFPSQVDLNPADTFNQLIQFQDKLIELLSRAEKEKWNLDRIKGNHPLIKFIKISYTDFFLFIDAHQRRHFWQIEQILKRLPE
ncbi:MAG: DinB family protein [Bacteroidota bacterium]